MFPCMWFMIKMWYFFVCSLENDEPRISAFYDITVKVEKLNTCVLYCFSHFESSYMYHVKWISMTIILTIDEASEDPEFFFQTGEGGGGGNE